ncbi:MAG TPA: Fis family transcriptional regulator, partial [Desulfomicrobium sp.]|nr:Fis family transcriptional regulator [Desulfomicrobium sp.]
MMSTASILIIDDEKDIRAALRGIFEDEGWQVSEAGSGTEGLSMALDGDFDLIFLDIWMPGLDGMGVLVSMREKGVDTPVIMISGHGNIETAVTALKNGAFDFIEKPLSLDDTLVAAGKALELSRLKRENRELRSRIRPEGVPVIIGSSPGIVRLRQLIEQVAPTEAWV